MEIILASSSPRRREIMNILTGDFRCVPADIKEVAPDEVHIEKRPEFLACQKARYVSKGYRNALVIGCDTSVIIDGKILNKPETTAHARRMLELLSGRVHKVITGCCICYGMQELSFSVTTEVEFYTLSEDEIEQYINTSEPYDKAGGYGIQGHGALFVKGIVGDYYNVVGMPISRIVKEAKKLTDDVENQKKQQ